MKRPVRPRDVMLFTVPPAMLLAYGLIAAVSDYSRRLQWRDSWPTPPLSAYFGSHLLRPLDFLRASGLERQLSPEAPEPTLVRIRVARNQWDALHAEQEGWGRWIDAALERDGAFQPINIRRRGDVNVHWSTIKRSFTFRTDRDELFHGFRTVALSNKEVLEQFIANRMTEWFAVMRPATELSPVFINDRFYGLFRMIERLDESFLRRQGRLPGNLYRGDAAERGDYYKNLPRELFSNPYIWERMASNDRPGATQESALLGFLDDLNGTTFAEHVELMQWLDRDEIAELIALMFVVGDPYHMSRLHNQFWYEDPSTGRLHPIPWDLRIHRLDQPRRPLNRFLAQVMRDPFVTDGVLRAAHRVLTRDSLVPRATALAEQTYSRYRPYFEFEHTRARFIPDVGRPDQLTAILRANARTLGEWIGDHRVDVVSRQIGSAGQWRVDILANGLTGNDLIAWTVPTGGSRPGTMRVVADADRDGRPGSGDRTVPGRWERAGDGAWRYRLIVPEPLLAAWNADSVGIAPMTQRYRFFVTASAGALPAPVLVNRITGAAATPGDSDGRRGTSGRAWHPWQYPGTPVGQTTRWSGTVAIDQTTVIAAQDTLVIAPGTVVRLAPDQSVLSRGLVLARGTASAPIRFQRASAPAPWGAFVLDGPGASGSRLDHVHFAGGGGDLIGRVEYLGMVNVHGAENVQIRDGVFRHNVRSDDTFHAVHAEVDLLDCHFADANSDAVDYDFSRGTIRGCRFEDSRNDAIDLMTSVVRIMDTDIRRSGDKGISVGEASSPFIFNTSITGSTRGMEIKDWSRPFVLNTTITGNGIGVLQNVKNWRYGGSGWATVVGSRVVDNEIDYQGDGPARLTIDESEIGNVRTSPDTGRGPVWPYLRYGIGVASPPRGASATWRDVPATVPIDAWMSSSGFADPLEQWRADGEGVVRFAQRRGTLVASVRYREGGMTGGVDWDCRDRPRGCVAVIEVAGRSLSGGRIVVTGSDSTVEQPFVPSDTAAVFALVRVRLPAGRYTRVRILGTPEAGRVRTSNDAALVDPLAGRIVLRGYAVYPVIEPAPRSP